MKISNYNFENHAFIKHQVLTGYFAIIGIKLNHLALHKKISISQLPPPIVLVISTDKKQTRYFAIIGINLLSAL